MKVYVYWIRAAHHKDMTKEKIRQANLGKKQSPQQIAKRVESRQKTLELKQNKRSH